MILSLANNVGLTKVLSPRPIYQTNTKSEQKYINCLICKDQFMDGLTKDIFFKMMSLVLVIAVISNNNK